MDHTYSRALDVPTANDLSFGHRVCGSKVAGPFNLLSSPEIFMSTQNNYVAAGSILSTASDLSKFSRFLLSKGQGIFSSPKIIEEMITGHNINTLFGSLVNFLGYSYTADGGALAAGYGFDIIGDVMYDHHYFDKGGDTIAFKTRNGFIPDQELGVVLLSNAETSGGTPSEAMLQDRIRTYILGIFLDVPKAQLQKTYDDAANGINAIRSKTTCDPHFFDGKPWDQVGKPIPKDKLSTLAGNYIATTSKQYYGNVTISISNDQAVLSYGAFAAPLYYENENSTTSYLWSSQVAMGSASNLEIKLSPTNATISWAGVDFAKQF
ncbi:hypothetical protein THRCLA_09903 [Thraustotheca clavata]|uniref:Beta-lactamase-related domain-containing protein n=1 Tax=Thraustotheca clavata TaxID=74557 RepID=A0A1V9YUB4_9STRA|nr:hypothetical protein THRCLA_09903 [Thraustotheca clavata]